MIVPIKMAGNENAVRKILAKAINNSVIFDVVFVGLDHKDENPKAVFALLDLELDLRTGDSLREAMKTK